MPISFSFITFASFDFFIFFIHLFFYFFRLQIHSRLNSCSSAVESGKRARLRWALLRDVIRADWWRYAHTLKVSFIFLFELKEKDKERLREKEVTTERAV